VKNPLKTFFKRDVFCPQDMIGLLLGFPIAIPLPVTVIELRGIFRSLQG